MPRLSPNPLPALIPNRNYSLLPTPYSLMIDSHCHLADETFASDLDAVIARAKEAGLERTFQIGRASCRERVSLNV